MLNSLKPAVLVCLTVIVLATIAATVVLIERGFAADAATLPIIVTGVVAIAGGQARTHEVAKDTNAKVQEVLNGGIATPVEHAVRKTLTRMAAEDQKNGTNIVQGAVDALATDSTPSQPPESS